MPKSWYMNADNMPKDTDTEEEAARKKLYYKICANKKPYFFGYNYKSMRAEYLKIMKEINTKFVAKFKKTFEDMKEKYDTLSPEERNFYDFALRKLNLDLSPSTMNRICWAVEKELDDFHLPDVEFDYEIYKSGVHYSQDTYLQVLSAVEQHLRKYKQWKLDMQDSDAAVDKEQIQMALETECYSVCPSRKVLCDILLDICYRQNTSHYIVWELCGEQIVQNLAERKGYTLTYPEANENGTFSIGGTKYSNKTILWSVSDET